LAARTLLRFIPRSLAPFERYPNELARQRVELGQLHDHHVPLASRFVGAGGALYTLDLWIVGVAQRSFHLVEGFIQAFDDWNLIVAAPIVRMQIENLVRTAYVFQAPEPTALVVKLVSGEQLNRMPRPEPRKLLTDAYLVHRAGLLYSWLPPVYDASNEWVHVSDRHVFNAINLTETGESTITFEGRIPLPIERIPVSFLADVLGAMREATRELFGLFETWEDWKHEHGETDDDPASAG